ncbi:hypothetical protein [Pseudomonas citronellolis]|uniref:hypothetical protein n=1 Tax=Pseudomonas citronellolis TaxID=53408 RepID=UPI0023E46708|nr:hypothetical protein [Pseudomonas citronellolis]MDF3935607.1 hypothetical protein [Pseudomonas citronellolis]
MKTYSAFLQRIRSDAGEKANLRVQVEAPSSAMARLTAEARFPGYRCASAPVPVR